MIFLDGVHVPASSLKLGKKPHRNDNRNLLLPNYLVAGHLPMVPTSWFEWRKRVKNPWGMHLNNTLGTCMIAGPANAEELFSACRPGSSGQIVVSDAQVLKEYESQGYIPGKPETDLGCDPLDVMKRWKSLGLFGLPPIEAFVSSSPGNLAHLRAGQYLLGVACMGFQMPITAQRQLDRGEPWDVVKTNTGDADKGSWGGHEVLGEGYQFGRGVDERYDCITWNQVQAMTPAFVEQYCDSCYFVLSPNWVHPDEQAANLFKHAELANDVQLLAS